MALIETRWITLLQEKALSLAGETWLRRLPFGRNWQRLRFGFLGSLQGGFLEGQTATTTIPDIKLMIGMADSTVWDKGLYCAHSFGYCLNGSAVIGTNASLTGVTNFPLQMWQGGAAAQCFSSRTEFADGIGQTRLSTSASLSYAFFPDQLTDGAKRRGLYVIDVTRPQGGSGNYTVDLYGPATGSTTFLAQPSDLMDVVASLNTSFTVNSFALNRSTFSLPVFEPGAGFDTIFIHNSCYGIPLMVYAVGALVYQDQPYSTAVAGGSIYTPNDAPVSGTTTPLTPSTDLTGGAGWSETFWTMFGTSEGTLITSGFTGTQAGPLEIFQLYDTSPTAYGSFISPTSFLTYGTGWDDTGIIAGTSAPSPQNGYAGTTMGWPYEVFQLYNTGSVASSVLTYGTGWSDPAALAGTGADRPQDGYSGTSMGWPYDSFEQYNTGTVITGVTINAGTGWSGPAYTY